jgi:hypothetical protein
VLAVLEEQLRIVYLATFVASVLNVITRPPGVPPVAPASDERLPRTMSLFPIPVNANVPVEILLPFVALLMSEIVEPVYAAVAYVIDVRVDPPSTLNDPATVRPEKLPVVPLIVPMVDVPMLAVPQERVPMVDVPVDAVKLDDNVTAPVTLSVLDNVTAPVTPSELDSVAAPVTPRVFEQVTAPVSVDAPTTENEPVLLTAEVDKESALCVSSPSVITCNEPSRPPVPRVLISCV